MSGIRDLTICLMCGRDYVNPVEWEEVSAVDWEVSLRCAQCGWRELGVFDQRTVDHFDRRLDEGVEVIERDLRELARENMAAEADRFAAALDIDAVLPEDF